MNQGDRAQAERHFRAGLAADPANAELRFCLGTVLAGQERLDEAIVELREAVRLCSDVAPYREGLARALLANALLSGRSTDEARDEAARALTLARANGDETTSAAAQRLLTLCHRQAPAREQPQRQKENP
jgi:tetratricopeptide (TPR) repeat protein